MSRYRAYAGALALLAVLLAAIGAGEWFRPRLQLLFGTREEVVLYFASPDAKRLVPQRRRVPRWRAHPRGALLELFAGPAAGSPLIATLPPDQRLLDFSLQGSVAVVDLGGELRTAAAAGTTGEALAVFSIVYTLTEWPQIRAVRILIDGEPVATLAGHLDLSMPLARADGHVAGIE
ncbi:MAG TPA: GerMN domain-containing protein [Limnochordia bacterium]